MAKPKTAKNVPSPKNKSKRPAAVVSPKKTNKITAKKALPKKVIPKALPPKKADAVKRAVETKTAPIKNVPPKMAKVLVKEAKPSKTPVKESTVPKAIEMKKVPTKPAVKAAPVITEKTEQAVAKKKKKKKQKEDILNTPEEMMESWKNTMKQNKKVVKDYSIREQFSVGDIINHSLFGQGIVKNVFDTNKMKVLFNGEVKILILNQTL
jgi:hypothetical protein